MGDLCGSAELVFCCFVEHAVLSARIAIATTTRHFIGRTSGPGIDMAHNDWRLLQWPVTSLPDRHKPSHVQISLNRLARPIATPARGEAGRNY